MCLKPLPPGESPIAVRVTICSLLISTGRSNGMGDEEGKWWQYDRGRWNEEVKYQALIVRCPGRGEGVAKARGRRGDRQEGDVRMI